MVKFLKWSSSVRVLLVEKTDRLYRNLKDYVTMDELDLEIHFVKESVVLSKDSRSSEKFMHGIKVLMAKNYIDNLSEETKKGTLTATFRQPFDLLAVTNTAWQNEKAAGVTSGDLRPIWLPAVDTLRNLFYAPTVEIKITFELIRQGSLAG